MTLAEMIVTFALLAIFMLAAAQVISYVIGIYYNAKTINYGMQVANFVNNKIAGEVENAGDVILKDAGAPVYVKCEKPANSDHKEIDSIEFVNKYGSDITMTVNDAGYLSIAYPSVEDSSGNGYEAVNWAYDEGTYMGYVINGLRFYSPGSEYPDNVIMYSVSLYNEKYGYEYEYDDMVQCFNINDAGPRYDN